MVKLYCPILGGEPQIPPDSTIFSNSYFGLSPPTIEEPRATQRIKPSIILYIITAIIIHHLTLATLLFCSTCVTTILYSLS